MRAVGPSWKPFLPTVALAMRQATPLCGCYCELSYCADSHVCQLLLWITHPPTRGRVDCVVGWLESSSITDLNRHEFPAAERPVTSSAVDTSGAGGTGELVGLGVLCCVVYLTLPL